MQIVVVIILVVSFGKCQTADGIPESELNHKGISVSDEGYMLDPITRRFTGS
jgi:hypothetical protein